MLRDPEAPPVEREEPSEPATLDEVKITKDSNGTRKTRPVVSQRFTQAAQSKPGVIKAKKISSSSEAEDGDDGIYQESKVYQPKDAPVKQRGSPPSVPSTATSVIEPSLPPLTPSAKVDDPYSFDDIFGGNK